MGLEASGTAGTEAGRAPGGRMALVVDLQAGEIGKMQPADAQAYFDRLGESLNQMRREGTPVTWLTMTPENRLHEPKPGAGADPRSTENLRDLGFFAGAERAPPETMAVFNRFMAEHGPKQNEAVYTKYFKSPFTLPEDYADRPGLRATMGKDYDLERFPLPEPGAFPGKRLDQYMREQGAGEAVIMGGMSSHCIPETAIGVAEKGFRATVARDLLIGWEGNERAPGYPYARIQHRPEGSDPFAMDRHYEQQVRFEAGEILKQPRDYSAGDLARIRANGPHFADLGPKAPTMEAPAVDAHALHNWRNQRDQRRELAAPAPAIPRRAG
jgi:nicotinamidase-related amidase